MDWGTLFGTPLRTPLGQEETIHEPSSLRKYGILLGQKIGPPAPEKVAILFNLDVLFSKISHYLIPRIQCKYITHLRIGDVIGGKKATDLHEKYVYYVKYLVG